MNNRFPSIVVLGVVVAILATILNKWVFAAIMLIGGAALAVIVWKLVDRGLFTPPTVLLDDLKEKFTGQPPVEAVEVDVDLPSNTDPDKKDLDGSSRTRRDE